jgi:hypothetical protein
MALPWAGSGLPLAGRQIGSPTRGARTMMPPSGRDLKDEGAFAGRTFLGDASPMALPWAGSGLPLAGRQIGSPTRGARTMMPPSGRDLKDEGAFAERTFLGDASPMALPWAGSEWPLAGRQIWREDATLFQRLRADWFKGFPSEIIHKNNGGGIMSPSSSVPQKPAHTSAKADAPGTRTCLIYFKIRRHHGARERCLWFDNASNPSRCRGASLVVPTASEGVPRGEKCSLFSSKKRHGLRQLSLGPRCRF